MLPPVTPNRPPDPDPDRRRAQQVASHERAIRNLQSYLNGGAVQQVPVLGLLPAAGRLGRLIIFSGDNRLYRDNGSSWVPIG